LSHPSKPKPHTRLVVDALEKSSLPFELRHVIRVMADMADRQTGVGRSGHERIAAALGCSIRSLARYQKQIRAWPGDPWITWKRTAAKGGVGRGTDVYTVRIGCPAKMPTLAATDDRAKMPTLARTVAKPKVPTVETQDAKSGRPKMPTVSEDPVLDPVLDPGGENTHPKREVFRTDDTGTRRVDPCAASFSMGSPIVVYAFTAWAEAFGKGATPLDRSRKQLLAERVAAGMTEQDANDVIAGALANDYVMGKKDGVPHNSLPFLFGKADQYEDFRDQGRALRERQGMYERREGEENTLQRAKRLAYPPEHFVWIDGEPVLRVSQVAG
jgi:hypothetical protein